MSVTIIARGVPDYDQNVLLLSIVITFDDLHFRPNSSEIWWY